MKKIKENNDVEYYERLISVLKSGKNIFFYGASKFLKEFLEKNETSKYNILGIVDRNKQLWGKTIGDYKIFPPSILYKIDKDFFIQLTIKNSNSIVEAEFRKYHCEFEILPSIFEVLPSISDYNTNENYGISPLVEKGLLDFNFVPVSENSVKNIEKLGRDLIEVSEMCEQDRGFLYSLVENYKPQKVLEVGVAQGASSVILLKALQKNSKNSHLYSLDYFDNFYIDNSKKTGWIVDNYPKLKKNWTFHAGGFILNHLDRIASAINEEEKFDMCFIDTMHCIPGEILETLMVLPYLKNDAILVFHDTNLQLDDNIYTHNSNEKSMVNNILMSAIKGEKFIPEVKNYQSDIGYFYNNIGAIKLNNIMKDGLYEIFNTLSLRWSYMPDDEDLNDLIKFFERFYNRYYCEYFKDVIKRQKYLMGCK